MAKFEFPGNRNLPHPRYHSTCIGMYYHVLHTNTCTIITTYIPLKNLEFQNSCIMYCHVLRMYWHILHSNTCKYIPVHELEDHISEKASTSCIHIRAAMKLQVTFSTSFRKCSASRKN